MLTELQDNNAQKAGTWEPPIEAPTLLVDNINIDTCSNTAWEILLKQHP